MTILVGEGVIPIRATDETAEGVAEAKRRLDGIRAMAKLDLDIDGLMRRARIAEAELDKLGQMEPTPEVDVQIEKARSNLRQIRAEANAVDRLRIAMRAEVDTSGARSNLRGLGNEATNADGQVRRLSGSGRSLASSFSSAAKVPAILFAIAAGAGAAGAALGALPGLASSLGGIGGVLAGSLSGVGEALKGYKTDQDAASASANKGASSAASNARAIRDASQAINDARRNQRRVAEDSSRAIEDAERNETRLAREGAEAIADASARVQDALDDERQAQEDVNDAFREATERLQDLRNEQDDYAIDAEGASIRVARQEENLRKVMADSSASDLDRREAVNDLAEARERLEDVQTRQGRSAAELAQIERTGLAGTDEVVSAQGRLRDAQEATKDAQEQLSRTTRAAQEANEDAARKTQEAVRQGAQAQEDAAMQVASALQGLDDAQASQAESANAGAAASSKYAEAMAKLTPEGRAFVQQLLRMQPLVDRLKNTSQRSFLPGLTEMLRDSEGLFPIFDGHLEKTGTIMGNTARKAGEMFKNPEFKKNLQETLDSSLPITQALGDGLVSLTGRVIKFGAEMAPASKGFSEFVTDTVDGFNGMLDRLAPHAESFRRIWEASGRVLKVLLPVLGDVVGWLADHLAPALEDTAGWLERNNGSLGTWVMWLGGAYLALKTLKTVGNLATWADGVMGSIGGIGRSAADADGKAKGLHGRLSSLKSLGKISLVVGLAIAGYDVVKSAIEEFSKDPNRSDAPWRQNDTNKDGKTSTGERWAGGLPNKEMFLSQAHSDLSEGWKAGGDQWGMGNYQQAINTWLLNPEYAQKIATAQEGIKIIVRTKWNEIKGELTNTVSGAADNVLSKFDGRGLGGWLGTTWGNISTGAGHKWGEFKTNVGNVAHGAGDWLLSKFDQRGLGGWLGPKWDAIKSGASQKWTDFRNNVGGVAHGAGDWILSKFDHRGLGGWLGPKWDAIRTGASQKWTDFRNNVGDVAARAGDWILSKFDGRGLGGMLGRAWDNIGRGASGAWNNIWRGIQDVSRKGLNGVIGALNWLSDKGNIVLRFLHVPEIPGIPQMAQGGTLGPQMLASGGRIGGGFMTNGPQAIVGEGKSAYPEFVIPTDPAYKGRAMELYGALGTQLMAQGGQVPMLADGGILGWLGDIGRATWGGITGAVSGIGNKLGDVMSWIGDMGSGLLDQAMGAIGGLVPGEPWKGMAIGGARGVFDGIKKMIENSFMTSGDPGGAGVQRWAPLVLRALAMMGQPASLLNVVLRRMNQESGGNPMAINNWDANARRGDPSRGLMQTIGSTFRANHFPGTSMNIYDPLANILASMKYAVSKYGSLAAAYNKKGGYALGGRIPGNSTKDDIPILAQSGERVLTRNQNDLFERFVALMEANGMGGQGDTIVNVQQVSGSPQETGRFVALAIR